MHAIKSGFRRLLLWKGVRKLQTFTDRYDYDYNDLDYLLQCVANGNIEALSHLYKITSTSVYAYALSILKNPQDAEDVLHDCFVRIFTYIGNYRSKGKPMAWILTITRNLCMNKLQQRKREPQLYIQDWKQYIEDRTGGNPEEKLLLRACMDVLSEEERQIVILHCVSCMSYRQIAQFLQLSVSTVISKYHRSIKKVKKILGEEV